MRGGALCEAAAQASGTKAGRPQDSAGESKGQRLPTAAHSSGAAGVDHHGAARVSTPPPGGAWERPRLASVGGSGEGRSALRQRSVVSSGLWPSPTTPWGAAAPPPVGKKRQEEPKGKGGLSAETGR